MPSEEVALTDAEEDYNALFEHLQKERYYGEVTFLVRNGEVAKVTFNETYVNVGKALAARIAARTPDEVEPRGVQQHGGKKETHLHGSVSRS